jgi:hypothetical protein
VAACREGVVSCGRHGREEEEVRAAQDEAATVSLHLATAVGLHPTTISLRPRHVRFRVDSSSAAALRATPPHALPDGRRDEQCCGRGQRGGDPGVGNALGGGRERDELIGGRSARRRQPGCGSAEDGGGSSLRVETGPPTHTGAAVRARAGHLDVNTPDVQFNHQPRVVLLSDCRAGHLFNGMSLPCSWTSASRQTGDLPLSGMASLCWRSHFLPSVRCTVHTMQTVFCLSNLQYVGVSLS